MLPTLQKVFEGMAESKATEPIFHSQIQMLFPELKTM